jgi:hypothetical protein
LHALDLAGFFIFAFAGERGLYKIGSCLVLNKKLYERALFPSFLVYLFPPEIPLRTYYLVEEEEDTFYYYVSPSFTPPSDMGL